MRNKIKKFENFSLNEAKKPTPKSPIDMEKLLKIAEAIEVICNGEYGNVYFNETENKVFVCLGDANPFDSEYLESFVQEAIAKNYKVEDEISVEVDMECSPSNQEGWKRYSKGKFK